jgi:hypothetical protein
VAVLTQRECLVEGLGDLPQCDELCGAFWAANALRAAGFADVTQERAAVVAGSVLLPSGSPSSLPPGERGRRPSVALPIAAEGAPSGTSAHGVARAISELSGGRLTAVPASGELTAARLVDLLGRLGDAVVIANPFTGELWDPSVGDEQVRRYLETGIDEGPANRWRVGHFLAVAHVVRGGAAPLVVLADSYPSRVMHLQPAGRVAASLRGRGLLVVTEEPDPVRAQVRAAGLEPVLWDNGSPMPS